MTLREGLAVRELRMRFFERGDIRVKSEVAALQLFGSPENCAKMIKSAPPNSPLFWVRVRPLYAHPRFTHVASGRKRISPAQMVSV